MFRKLIIGAALFTLSCASITARAEASEKWSEADDWTITLDPGDNCAVASGFEGGWTFALAHGVDRTYYAILLGPLPFKPGDHPELSVELGDQGYSGGGVVIEQFETSLRAVMPMDASFSVDMATAPSVRYYDPEGEKIVGLTLDDMTRPLAELNRCWDTLVKLDKGSGQPAKSQAKINNNGSIIGSDDYPAGALRAGASGRTTILLTVSAHGVASDCIITASSGNAELDDSSCALFKRRGRFTAALDAAGQPTTGSFSTSVNWQIPAE